MVGPRLMLARTEAYQMRPHRVMGHGSWYGRGLEAVMFGRDEVLQDLHGRLVTAGINPLDPQVQAICEIVNAFYAEKTREVLEKMQAVLDKIAP